MIARVKREKIFEQFFLSSAYFFATPRTGLCHRGNFGCKGLVSAEQNHSSVKNYLGSPSGSTLFIFENVKKLINGHIQHNIERSRKSNMLYVTSLLYKRSTFLGYLRKVDVDSKKVLSQTA